MGNTTQKKTEEEVPYIISYHIKPDVVNFYKEKGFDVAVVAADLLRKDYEARLSGNGKKTENWLIWGIGAVVVAAVAVAAYLGFKKKKEGE